MNLIRKNTSIYQICLLPLLKFQLFKQQPHKMVKHTQTIRRQIADKLFECLAIFGGWRLKI